MRLANRTLRRVVAAAAMSLIAAGCGTVAGPESYGLTSYRDLRYSGVVRQSLDFTCGGASIATVLSHYWGRPTTEIEVLAILRERYPDPKVWKAKIESGFSFDDLIFAVEVLGFDAAGAKISIDELAALEGPVIVHLDKGEFQHFAVLRAAKDGVFYMADSIVGNIGLDKHQFAKQYSGNALAIWKGDAKLPKASVLRRIRDGLSVSATTGWLLRDVPMRGVPPF